ncbi:MAG: xanthine dehydrogenase family protein molybdopterin-binding subunit [Rhodospirillaceae bacterium]|nr:xanthine dehydrogenase family protein molybdopterin-binding subunit [Rhodospirillaceae bacterium]
MSQTTTRNVPRRETRRLVAGHGSYTGDLAPARLAHVAFLRSPHAHARITAIDTAAAQAMPGIVAVVTWADLAAVCQPMQTAMTNAPDHVSPPQAPLADGVARWQGEPVAAVVADTLAAAEDAVEAIEVEWDALPAVADAAAAMAAGAPAVHPSLGHNRALERVMGKAEIGPALAKGEVVVTAKLGFNRHTGVPLEPRVVVADYEPIDGTLTVHQSHQTPQLMQDIYARLLGLPEHRVRVICRDVGGGFGIKLHVYPDEVATVALARLLGRPVRFESRRTEAFVSDAHAREFEVAVQLAAGADGTIAAIDTDLLCAAGAYSIYPRGSIGDAILAAMMIGTPYRVEAQRARVRVAYQNKVPSGSYRGVGQPIACAVTEVLIDDAAHALGQDPAEFRRRAYHREASLPLTTAGGMLLESLSLAACLDGLLERMDYPALRREQAALRAEGRVRGIGVATFVEQTAPGIGLYGPTGIRLSAQDTAIVKFEPNGAIRCAVGCTDQGQGTLTGIAQIVAGVIGTSLDDVLVEAGDSAGPHGGGAWASRGLSIGGEAAHGAATDLRAHLLDLAAALLQAKAESLDIRAGTVIDRATGAARMPLAELARIAHYRADLLPGGIAPRLAFARSFAPTASPYFMANGVQGCLLDIERETGVVTLVKHWVVEDCGRVVNADLVDGQLRGGVVQGLGAALLEHCVYDGEGQLLAGSLMDYAMPRADNMPPIEIGHVQTPQPGTALGVKGAGEAGTVGATAAMWCAVNDALRPLGARLDRMPFTSEAVLRALNGAGAAKG